MVCFGYIIVNTLYKVNNNNNDLRLSSKTHRNSTKLWTHQLLPTTVFIPNILMSNPTPSTQTEQYTYSVESSNFTNMLHQKKILWTTNWNMWPEWLADVILWSKKQKETKKSQQWKLNSIHLSSHFLTCWCNSKVANYITTPATKKVNVNNWKKA